MSPAGRRIPIKVKLLAVLAVPVLGYLLVTTTAVLQARQEAERIRDQADVVKTAVGPTSLTTSLIDERTIAALEQAGIEDELKLRIGDSTQARQATDEHLSALQTLVENNDAAREAYKSAVDDLDTAIAALRQDVDAGQEDIGVIFSRYSEHIAALMDANEGTVEMLDDAELWQGAKLAELATRQKDARALLINALVPIGFNEDEGLSNAQSMALGRALGTYESRDVALQGLATGAYARPGSVLVEALEANDLAALARQVLDSGRLALPDLYTAASYEGGFVYDAPTGDFIHDNFRGQVVEILDEEASRRTTAANESLRNHLVSGSVGLLLTAVIAWAVSRSITRPLRALADQAADTATERLPETVREILETPLGENVVWPQPEPITVVSRDEVADVAQALNTMQDSALRLAVEEAILRRHITDSLVTLGQRNQGLLSRQISFITDLERDETNPDVLANLFYLDHLATRMRRNAESLLVLAGIDPPRKWVGPTPVNDVIRAALGEAEEYKRVQVEEVQPATVVGQAAAELSHLLAELIENALVFSPPNRHVEVKGRRRSMHDGPVSGGYTITVRDFGVGMSAEELNQANRRLAGEESYTIAPSKYMGHYVAGKLAARHGITVQLRNAGGGRGGTVVTVEMPATLLTAEAPSPDATEHMPPLPPARPVPRVRAVPPVQAVPNLPEPEPEPRPAPAPAPAPVGSAPPASDPPPVPPAPTRPERGTEDEEEDPAVVPTVETPATLATLATPPPDLDDEDEATDENAVPAEIYILPPPPLEPLPPVEASPPPVGPSEPPPPELPPPVRLPHANAGRGAASGRGAGSGRGTGSGRGAGAGSGSGARSGSGSGAPKARGKAPSKPAASQRKPPKKRKKRSPPLAANKLPVPPPSQPLEASSDD